MDPRWDDENQGHGAMVRAGLWLSQEIGEGNVFTKQALRDAFPGISQIDRRVRDLRSYGWEIYTNVNDETLKPHEQRLIRQGIPVWNSSQRRAADANKTAQSNKAREAVFSAANYQCQICGIAAGQPYPDRPAEVAVLGCSNRTLIDKDGKASTLLIAECKGCKSGARERKYSVSAVRSLLEELDDSELRAVQRWNARGTRGTTQLDRAWQGLRQLPAEQRTLLLDSLTERKG